MTRTTSFCDKLSFSEEKVVTQLILETEFSKEIRILMREGQTMKKHQAPLPIIVHLLEGKVDFEVEEETILMEKGNILTLGAKVAHSLKAHENSVIRLTLSKTDKVSRVENVTNN